MLEFKRTKLTYTDSKGDFIPGTTTVLNILAKDALVPWAVGLTRKGLDYNQEREHAANIGTIGHYYIEQELKGLSDHPDTGVSLEFGEEAIEAGRKIFNTFLDWKIDNGFEASTTEIPLSNQHYGGTLDIIGTKASDNTDRIYDVKTSSGVYYSHLIQLAAYRRLNREAIGFNLGCSIIHLPRKGGIKVVDFSEGDLNVAEHAFSHCLQMYNAKQTLERIMKSHKGVSRSYAKAA